MDVEKRKQLAEKGWTSVSVQEFLGLTPEETAYIERQEQAQIMLTSQSKEKSAPSADRYLRNTGS